VLTSSVLPTWEEERRGCIVGSDDAGVEEVGRAIRKVTLGFGVEVCGGTEATEGTEGTCAGGGCQRREGSTPT
jgi:hypothetical protein